MKMVYIATFKGEIIGVYSSPHLASADKNVNDGYGTKDVETSWGWVINARKGVVEVRGYPVQD